jgi:UDP-glucose 4-epimerase
MAKFRNFLVTGGSGFIGSHLVDKLRKDPERQVTVFDLFPRPYAPPPEGTEFIQGDLHDLELVRRTIIDQGIEVVYHLAWASIHETSIENPVRDVQSNLIPSIHLLEACRNTGVKRVVFLSSGGTVYGLPQVLPITEDHPTSPISAYGITKLSVEKYLQLFTYLYHFDHVILRPSVPYGPRQNPRRRQGAVSVFTYLALKGEPITIWGDGSVSRDFFYIDDLIDALLMACDSDKARNEIINIGGPKAYSLDELLITMKQVLGVDVQVIHESSRDFDVPEVNLDINRAKKLLEWTPAIELPEGIRKTAKWIKHWMDDQ